MSGTVLSILQQPYEVDAYSHFTNWEIRHSLIETQRHRKTETPEKLGHLPTFTWLVFGKVLLWNHINQLQGTSFWLRYYSDIYFFQVVSSIRWNSWCISSSVLSLHPWGGQRSGNCVGLVHDFSNMELLLLPGFPLGWSWAQHVRLMSLSELIDMGVIFRHICYSPRLPSIFIVTWTVTIVCSLIPSGRPSVLAGRLLCSGLQSPLLPPWDPQSLCCGWASPPVLHLLVISMYGQIAHFPNLSNVWWGKNKMPLYKAWI